MIYRIKTAVRVYRIAFREVDKNEEKLRGNFITSKTKIPMKKIVLSLVLLNSTIIGFSQSVTILPTSSFGGGSSQWTTVGNNIHYGAGGQGNVGIGTSTPFYPLVVRQNGGGNDQAVFSIERLNNNTPYQSFVKFGGTTANPQPVTPGELGIIAFSGSTSAGTSNWSLGASIRAVARGIFSSTNSPGQLEFSTTPASSTLGPQVRMTINEEGKIGINNNTPISQLDLRYDGSSTYGVHNPMLNIKGPDNLVVHTRYSNSSTTNFSILQEVTPNTILGNSSIRWRWYDNAVPSVGTTMFQWANNSFDVTGALTTTGNATINGNGTTLGTSSLRGKVTVGSTTTTGNGLEIQSSSSSMASPDIYIRSLSPVIRYGTTAGTLGMMQSVTNSAVPGSALMSWSYLDNSTPTVQTTMMTLDGEGDLTVNGFTKLGSDPTTTTAGVTRSSPAMKTILLTGNIAAGATVYTTTVPHGLNASKIVEVKVLVSGLNNFIVDKDFVDNRTAAQGAISGYQFTTFTDATNVYILRHQTNGNNINNANGLVSTYRIMITYVP